MNKILMIYDFQIILFLVLLLDNCGGRYDFTKKKNLIFKNGFIY